MISWYVSFWGCGVGDCGRLAILVSGCLCVDNPIILCWFCGSGVEGLDIMFLLAIKMISFLFIVYGIIIFLVSSGSRFFFFWVFSGLAGFCLSEMGDRGMFRLLPDWVSCLLLFVAVIAMSVYIYIAVKILRHFHDMADNDPDYLIILGCHVSEDGPCVSLRYRLNAAGDYMRHNKKVKAVLSGGQGLDEPVSEAEAMRDYLVEHYYSEENLTDNNRKSAGCLADNIPYSNEGSDENPDDDNLKSDGNPDDDNLKSDGNPDDDNPYKGSSDGNNPEIGSARLILEKQSRTTGQNLCYSFCLTGDVPVCVVTNNFHMYRALMLAHKAGYEDISGIAAPSTVFFLPNNITREVLAVLKDKIVSGHNHRKQ